MTFRSAKYKDKEKFEWARSTHFDGFVKILRNVGKDSPNILSDGDRNETKVACEFGSRTKVLDLPKLITVDSQRLPLEAGQRRT